MSEVLEYVMREIVEYPVYALFDVRSRKDSLRVCTLANLAKIKSFQKNFFPQTLLPK